MPKLVIRGLIALFALSAGAALAGPVLNSAVLPNARVVPLADTATIFMTTLNTGDMDATNCVVVKTNQISFSSVSEIDMNWALTGPGGALVGNQNDPFTIAAGGQADLVLGFARNATAGQFGTDFTVIVHVECDGGFGSTGRPAVNGARIRFSDTLADVIPIVQTFTADGIANFDDTNRLAVLSVAAINNSAVGGAEADIDVNGDYLGFTQGGQFDFFVCETDPATGVCLGAPVTCAPDAQCLTTKLGATPRTFAFFIILPAGKGALFAPAVYRFAATFSDQQSGALVASTSVALNSSIPVIANPPRPNGQYEMIIRNTDDRGARTVRPGVLNISDRFISGRISRFIDQGSFIQLVEQYFREPGAPAVFNPAAAPEQPQKGGPARPESSDGFIIGDVLSILYNEGVATPSATAEYVFGLELSRAIGGTMASQDVAGQEQFPDPVDSDLLDMLDATKATFIQDATPRLPIESLGIASHFTVSETGDPFDPRFTIPLKPTLSDDVVGSSFTTKGCTFKIMDAGTANDGNTSLVTHLALVLVGCDSTGVDDSIIDTESYANVETKKRGTSLDPFTQMVMSFVFGDKTDPNAVVFTILMKYKPPAAPGDAPQTAAAAAPTKSRRQQIAQEIADERGKPVFWRVGGKDVLIATPRVGAAAGSGN